MRVRITPGTFFNLLICNDLSHSEDRHSVPSEGAHTRISVLHTCHLTGNKPVPLPPAVSYLNRLAALPCVSLEDSGEDGGRSILLRRKVLGHPDARAGNGLQDTADVVLGLPDYDAVET